MQEEVKHYKVKSLPTQLRPNSVYYVKATSQSAVNTYITDQNGFPFPLIDLTGGGNVGVIQSVTGTGVTGTFSNPIINISTFKSSDSGNLIEISSNDGKLFVKPITSPDGSIDIVSTASALELQLGVSLQTQIQNALQPGDNVSELINDAGYLTQDNVVEFANLAAFPVTGVIGTIYIAIDTGLFYSWNGTTYIPSSAPSTGITGVGTTNYLSKFTSPTTIGNSNILNSGQYIFLNYTGRPLLSGNTFVSIQRNQSQIDFILGNPGFSQPSFIVSDNQTDGFEIHSKGELALKTGATYANEGLRVFSTGKLKFTQTPDTGATSDFILLRDTSGNIKQIAYPTIPSGTVTGSGTIDYLPRWTSSTALGDSPHATTTQALVVNNSGRGFLDIGTARLSVQRAQSQIDFNCGNADASQVSSIWSDNPSGLELKSKGTLSLKTGTSYLEGINITTTGKLKFTQTPDTGATSDFLLMRDTSGNVKQIAGNTYVTTANLTLQNAYNNSTDGKIILDATRGNIKIKSIAGITKAMSFFDPLDNEVLTFYTETSGPNIKRISANNNGFYVDSGSNIGGHNLSITDIYSTGDILLSNNKTLTSYLNPAVSHYFKGISGVKWESDVKIEYAADYSASYSNRSLIDKGYADSRYYPIPTGTTAQYIDGTGALQTFPTIPSLTGYVPYTGATADLDLGANSLTAKTLTITDNTNSSKDLYLNGDYPHIVVGISDGFIRTEGIALYMGSNNNIITFSSFNSGGGRTLDWASFNRGGSGSYLNTRFNIGTNTDLGYTLGVNGSIYGSSFVKAGGTSSEYLMADGSVSTGGGTVTSVGLTMPSAFSVTNSPITSSGDIAVTGAGTASQYIRGDGQLATFPSGGSGGSSVNYYLNGSIAASVATYQQMSNTAIIGAGTDFTKTGNGLIAQFLTDVGNPNRLEIPGGAWNFEMFFSMSSGGGSPKFYVELLKYDGTTFTSIASTSAIPETISGGTPIDLYLTSLAVPTTALLVTDRLAIRVYIVDNSGGRTATLHTEDNHLCEIITTFSGGVTSLNGLTANTQYLAVGTSGTDFTINSLLDTHTFNLPTASASNRGALSSTDWSTFDSKQAGSTNLTSLSALSYASTSFVKMTAAGTFSLDTSTYLTSITSSDVTTALGYTPVTNARTLTINGTAYDLTADRSWTITASGKSINTVSVNTSAGSASSTDYVYLASGTINITLPTAVGNENLYTIKNVGTGVITVDTTSSQTIDGSLTAPIRVQYLSLTLVSDGANWNII